MQQLFLSLAALPLALLMSFSYAQDSSENAGTTRGSYLCNWQDVEVAPTFNASHLNGTWYEIANTALSREADNNSCACSAARFTRQNQTSGGGGGGGGQALDQEEWEKTGNYSVNLLCYNTTNNSVVGTPLDAYFPLSPAVGALAYSNPGGGQDAQQQQQERESLYPGGVESLILSVGIDNSTNNSQYVVLGSPCFLDARIYSRSPTMSDAAYQDATNVLKDRGYPLTILGLEKTNQNETFCAPMTEFISNLTQAEANETQGGGGTETSAPPTLRRTLFFR